VPDDYPVLSAEGIADAPDVNTRRLDRCRDGPSDV
jgi:hypothetical protein